MKKKIFISVLFVVLLSCYSQQPISNFEKEFSVELFFYPSGVAKNIRHSISITGDTLTIKDSKHTDRNNSRILSRSEINKLHLLYKEIGSKIFENKEIVEDAWGAKLIINGIIKYEHNDFARNKIMSHERFIDYLMEISKLKLNGFSY